MSVSFFSLSFLGYVVPVHWASPPPKTPDFTLSPPLIFSCQNLAEIALFENEYGSSTQPNSELDTSALWIAYIWPRTSSSLLLFLNWTVFGHGQCSYCFLFGIYKSLFLIWSYFMGIFYKCILLWLPLRRCVTPSWTSFYRGLASSFLSLFYLLPFQLNLWITLNLMSDTMDLTFKSHSRHSVYL